MTNILDSFFSNKNNYEQEPATKLGIMRAVTQYTEFTKASFTFQISHGFTVGA
jgi:hypothetical protein